MGVEHTDGSASSRLREPGSLQVGVDLCWVDDVAAAVASFGDRYLHRVFTDAELAECPAIGEVGVASLAARFAAKEAALKVLRPVDEGIDWRSIEVRRAPGGACGVELHGAASDLARRRGVHRIAISLSHEHGMAAAIAVGEVRDGWAAARGESA